MTSCQQLYMTDPNVRGREEKRENEKDTETQRQILKSSVVIWDHLVILDLKTV